MVSPCIHSFIYDFQSGSISPAHPAAFYQNELRVHFVIITTTDCRFKTLFDLVWYFLKTGSYLISYCSMRMFYGLKCIILFCLRSVPQALERLCVQLSTFQRESHLQPKPLFCMKLCLHFF